MGIRGLTSLIKKYVPNAIKVRPFNYFNGSVIAIDTSILLYKFSYSNSNPNSHINGFLHKCLSYIKHGIIPVFILDGKPPPEKNCVILKRSKQKKKIEMRIKEMSSSSLENLMNIQKLNKQIINVTTEHRKEAKELLSILGFCVINSPGEAESICASLQKNGIVDFTYSDDTDALVLGCKKVLRSNTNTSFDEIDLDTILCGLDLNVNEFIDLCILCGCDYCSTIPKLNYTTAYELILKHKNIETILDNIKDTYNIPVNFDYNKARCIFSQNNNILQPTTTKIPEINEENLKSFLHKKNYDTRYINEYIKNFKNALYLFPKTNTSQSLYFNNLN